MRSRFAPKKTNASSDHYVQCRYFESRNFFIHSYKDDDADQFSTTIYRPLPVPLRLP